MAKKKKKRKEELDEDYTSDVQEAEEEPADVDYTPPSRRPTAKPRNDAYVMMLAITFLALVAGCVLMYLDAAQYEGKNPPPAAIPALPELGKAAAPAGPPTK
jgi:hypothetical protein